MKTTLSTAVAALALFALAGCSGSADPAPTPGGTSPGAAATTGAPAAGQPTGPVPTKAPAPQLSVQPDGKITAPEGFHELPAAQVDAKALPDSYQERRVWASADGKSLQLIAIARDACAGIDASVAQATDAMVTVVLAPQTSPQGGPEGGKVCATVLTPRAVEIPLDQPVGDRKVVVTEAVS
ncbi:hypothetical protein [Actinokineospora enzanensis]|uniref:hypothetical protein n=1 Tax=Actinokineospora enzanensis TaxID=155975 RepID=UPI0003707E49|nr:hypothetical protein [Actinokineospora enzanensis]